MADTSLYTIEERLIASVWVHDRARERASLEDIRKRFSERFNKPAPKRDTLYTWEKKAFTTGSVLDSKRSGRPRTRELHVESVEESCSRSPQKSSRKRSSELGIPRSTLQKIMKKDLGLKPYRPSCVNQLSDVDMDARKAACQVLLRKFPTAESRKNVFFSDECAIYLSNRSRNVYFWCKTNPHYYEEIEQHPPHVMMWAAISANHLIGPYFFNTSVDRVAYLTMLQKYFVPQLRSRQLEESAILQQDGAPAHFALCVREFLDTKFRGRWIGRGSDMPWPARSPDLSTCDNSLWGIVKQKISQLHLRTVEDLETAVKDCFLELQPSTWNKMSERTWRKIRFCAENGGVHTEV